MYSTSIILNILGLLFNIVGAIVITFSLDSYLRTIRLALSAHEHFITSFKDPTKYTIHSTGTEVHLVRHHKKSYVNLRIGVGLVVVGFFEQLISYLILIK